MSVDPEKGVVDPSFRVYGATNVHVCDASVFPSSITVNPQLTVMALARVRRRRDRADRYRAGAQESEPRFQRVGVRPRLVGAERPRAHAGAQVMAEARVVLGHAVDGRAQRAGDIHARALGGRAGGPVAAAQAHGGRELL